MRTEGLTGRLALSGRVETLEGAPVEGVTVSWYAMEALQGQATDQGPVSIPTDAQGRFVLRVPGAGGIVVEEGAAPVVVSAIGRAILPPGEGACSVQWSSEDDMQGQGDCRLDGNLSLRLPRATPVRVVVEHGSRFSYWNVETQQAQEDVGTVILAGDACLAVVVLDKGTGEPAAGGLVSLTQTSAAGVFGLFEMVEPGGGLELAHLPAGVVDYEILGRGDAEPVKGSITLRGGGEEELTGV